MESIILASASPRRKDLLKQIKIPFEVICSECEEKVEDLTPWDTVQLLARQKAEDVAKKVNQPGRMILGADTVVAFGRKILGKPKDKDDAAEMIKMLEGKKHQVYTGVCFTNMTEQGEVYSETFYEETTVFVYPMSEQEIMKYIEGSFDEDGKIHFDWSDKAGAYGIQGEFAAFIQGIHGDYNNVVGLPVAKVYQKLKEWNKIR